jgi:RNA polymerase sigma factor (sigma-70 family)
MSSHVEAVAGLVVEAVGEVAAFAVVSDVEVAAPQFLDERGEAGIADGIVVVRILRLNGDGELVVGQQAQAGKGLGDAVALVGAVVSVEFLKADHRQASLAILALSLGGDEDSLSALMERHGDKLTLYLDGCLHDLHESEDLMIEAFAYLIAKQPRIRDGGFKAYLYKAARHMALRHRSKRRLMFSLDALTDEPDGQLLAEEVIGTAERNRILHGCMGEMNPDYREVLYLTYFEGMSYAQAAEVTGKTVKQITNLVYRGKESLRKLLEREEITNAEP